MLQSILLLPAVERAHEFAVDEDLGVAAQLVNHEIARSPDL